MCVGQSADACPVIRLNQSAGVVSPSAPRWEQEPSQKRTQAPFPKTGIDFHRVFALIQGTKGNFVSTTNEVAVIKTNEGDMTIAFWPDVAPKTVENFKKLAREGFYDGTAFHRIVKGFMIQGGDPLSKKDDPMVGTGGPGYKLKAEFNDRPHVRGVLSMARSQQPDSAGSQFFICLADAKFLDRQYTAFGQVIKGDDVLGRIGDTPTIAGGGGERSKPTKRVAVESVRIVPAE
jgi:peptidyl-prolyl cis-trans isomerase B (cyclophilin B)